MSRSIWVELELPEDLKTFHLPGALRTRLNDLLDRQDDEGKLTARERREAQALVDLADMLSLMKLKAKRIRRTKVS